MIDDLYEKFKRWFNMEDAYEERSQGQSEYSDRVLADAFRELARLRKELHNLKESEQKRKFWLEEAKEQAGYDSKVSFDIVWEETLELANRWKEQQTRDKAIK